MHIGARNIKPLYSGSILFELSTPRRALFAIFKSYLKKTEPFRPPPISCQLPQPTRQPQFHGHLNSATATTTMSHV